MLTIDVYRKSSPGSSDDSVKILSLSVTPDPPEKGQRVTADIQMQFSEF